MHLTMYAQYTLYYVRSNAKVKQPRFGTFIDSATTTRPVTQGFGLTRSVLYSRQSEVSLWNLWKRR